MQRDAAGATVPEGTLLWTPSAAQIERANLTRYQRWLEQTRGLRFASYDDLWRWSVEDLEGFWASIWDFFGIRAHRPSTRVLADRHMPGARWFVGAELSYAEHALRRRDDHPAIVFRQEDGPLATLSYADLGSQVAGLAAGLRRLGVRRGDRVAAYLPNVPQTVVAFLATASLGAIWSACPPEFGLRSVVDRFAQIEPRVLLAVDGYRYHGRPYQRLAAVAELQRRLPTLEKTIVIPYLDPQPAVDALPAAVRWQDVLEAGADPAFEVVPFDHPLWVLYSSGTTGLPKAIVHGHGGILIEHLKSLALHQDLTADDRFFWYTTTGWMMWNRLVSGLLLGATIVLYDGSPAYPDLRALWQLAEAAGVTFFGVGAPYLQSCLRAGLAPGQEFDLSRLRAIGSTGSPLPPEAYAWVYRSVRSDLPLASSSGGTDVCTAFVGGCPTLPVRAGEIQCRALGASVAAFDPEGRPLVNEVGELVVTAPMPSMPLGFWNDPDGRRYRESYFEQYPGVWRHGDWIRITDRGSCVIYGRSDATLNRGGVRMGTAEFYRVVEELPEVRDSLVVDTGGLDREGRLLLFVVLREDASLGAELRARIAAKVRQELSPRHVPDAIYAAPDLPRTLNGKKVEVPVKRILLGTPPEQAISADALANPEALQFFAELARRGDP